MIPTSTVNPRIKPSRPAFSLVEMLIALTISVTLLTACLTAFDASWRGYRHTTETASTHVVSRIVMHRLQAMIRTGSQFGPYPADVLDAAQNPLTSNFMEFVSEEDRVANNGRITRIERRNAPTGAAAPFELWYVLLQGGAITQEHPLLRDIRESTFILEYEPGPRLIRATVDLAIQPNDDQDIRTGINFETPTIRLVASAVPRQLQ